jgi:Flp pilus assembly protein TadD
MSRQDRLTSDLERGFSALEEGRVDDAASILERVQRIDRQNPDVVTLAAAVADASGDPEAALGHYRTLAELRPDDPMPRGSCCRIREMRTAPSRRSRPRSTSSTTRPT